MTDDIIPPKPLQGRFNHDHRWHFLQTRSVFEALDETSTTFRQSEYSYFVCNDCPDNDYMPQVIKTIVKNKS